MVSFVALREEAGVDGDSNLDWLIIHILQITQNTAWVVPVLNELLKFLGLAASSLQNDVWVEEWNLLLAVKEEYFIDSSHYI